MYWLNQSAPITAMRDRNQNDFRCNHNIILLKQIKSLVWLVEHKASGNQFKTGISLDGKAISRSSFQRGPYFLTLDTVLLLSSFSYWVEISRKKFTRALQTISGN